MSATTIEFVYPMLLGFLDQEGESPTLSYTVVLTYVKNLDFAYRFEYFSSSY